MTDVQIHKSERLADDWGLNKSDRQAWYRHLKQVHTNAEHVGQYAKSGDAWLFMRLEVAFQTLTESQPAENLEKA